MQGWWRHYWTDDRLQWSPAEYGNVTEIMVPMQDMWIPDTHVYTKIGGATDSLNSVFVAVYSSGDCFVSIPRTITFGCYMQLARFPFDTQICWCVTTMLVVQGSALVCWALLSVYSEALGLWWPAPAKRARSPSPRAHLARLRCIESNQRAWDTDRHWSREVSTESASAKRAHGLH